MSQLKQRIHNEREDIDKWALKNLGTTRFRFDHNYFAALPPEKQAQFIKDFGGTPAEVEQLLRTRWSADTHISFDRPWMAALEMQFAALSEVTRVYRTAVDVDPDWRVLTGQTLRRAECFAWTADTTNALAFAARSIPLDATLNRDDLPASVGWWWFHQPIDPRVGPDKCLLSGLMWGPDAGNVGVWAFIQNPAGHFHGNPIPAFDFSLADRETLSALAQRQGDIGRRLRQLDDGLYEGRSVASVEIARLLIAGCAWLKQRVVVFSDGHVERHRRKQLLREHDAVVSDVKVVQLRRAEYQPRDEPEGNGEPVDWSCRWIVNGHWRNQYHPSSGNHELKYILPYVKGPADKPLKVPTHTVYAVAR